MILKDPIGTRETIEKKRGWNTIEEIAAKLDIASNTVGRAFRGEPVRLATIRKLAQAIDMGASEIAVVVPRENRV